MPNTQDGLAESPPFLHGVDACLSEAQRTGEPVELIFAVRGRVQQAPGKHRGRWRVRTGKGHVVTFRPEFVVAFNGTSPVQQTSAPVRRLRAASGGRGGM